MYKNVGFIKLFRSILDWEWYADTNVKVVFLHLLLTASYKDTNWKGIIVKAGQVVIGSQKLADSVNLSRQQVRTALNKLISSGEITIKTTNKYSLVTIVKWRDYQYYCCGDNHQFNEEMNNKKPHKNNNKKNRKKYEINNSSYDIDELEKIK